MNKLPLLKHLFMVWITEKFYGARHIKVQRTTNTLFKEFTVQGTTYSFECYEYQYNLHSVRWYVPTHNFYMYRVVMFDGTVRTHGTYPQMSMYNWESSKYGHHLAIRAHIQKHIGK